jgi:hypothetical protein
MLISQTERAEARKHFDALLASRDPAKSDAFNKAVEKAASAIADVIIEKDRSDIEEFKTLGLIKEER